MARTGGTRIRGSKGVAKPKTGKGMNLQDVNPGAEQGWDLFDLFTQMMGEGGNTSGGETVAPKGEEPFQPFPGMPDLFPGMASRPSSGGPAHLVGKGGHSRTGGMGTSRAIAEPMPTVMPGSVGQPPAMMDQPTDTIFANEIFPGEEWNPFGDAFKTIPSFGPPPNPTPNPMRTPGPAGPPAPLNPPVPTQSDPRAWELSMGGNVGNAQAGAQNGMMQPPIPAPNPELNPVAWQIDPVIQMLKTMYQQQTGGGM